MGITMPPSWIKWYKKPSYVDIKQFANNLKDKARSPTSTPRTSLDLRRQDSTDIPSHLSLERILQNQTCSPMSLHDFYMYLKYIEYSPENLEFYLWFREYEASYTTSTYPIAGAIPSSWAGRIGEAHDQTPPSSSGSLESRQCILNLEKAELNARIVALGDANGPCSGKNLIEGRNSIISFTFATVFRSKSADSLGGDKEELLGEAAKRLDSRKVELQNIANFYLQPGSPSELNIPYSMREKALHAITTSTSPHHLKPIADHCYLLLRFCSHRNFIRLGVGNGTFETLCMATGLGIVLTIAGVLCMLLLAFASPSFRQTSRWYGLAAWPMWAIGVGLILSGLRGSCFFLLLFSRRQPLPWEKLEDATSVTSSSPRSKLTRFFSQLMIFDRKIRVEDDNLRALQHKIVAQSIVGGMLFATIMEVIFLLLPIWR